MKKKTVKEWAEEWAIEPLAVKRATRFPFEKIYIFNTPMEATAFGRRLEPNWERQKHEEKNG